MDPIDRILSNEPVLKASEQFTAGVMSAVRAEAAAPPPIAFPWRRFLPGLFTALALTLAAFVLAGLAGDGGVTLAPDLSTLVDDPTARGIGLQSLVVLMSLGATAWIVRNATRARTAGTF